MRGTEQTIDEYTLASYLAGELSPGRRRQVARLLAENDEARELVLAARQLLDDDPAGPDARSRLLAPHRVRLAIWIAGISVLVVAVAVTTMIAARFRDEVVALRGQNPPLEDASWRVDLAVSDAHIEWQAIPDASYQVVFWDLEEGQVALRIAATSLGYDLGTASLPEVDRPYSVWVEAVGRDGIPIKRTRAIPFKKAGPGTP